MSVALIQYLIVLIINIIGLGILIFIGFLIYKNFEGKKELELFRIEMIASKDTSINIMLDKLIIEQIEQYRILEIESGEPKHITEEMHRLLISKITTQVLKKISPSLYSKLGLIYNPDLIKEIIVEKISLQTIELVVNNNSELDDKG